jgi:Rieske Fe-S protein
MRTFGLIALCLWIIASGSSCNDSAQVTQAIPKGPVNINIDLNLPSYMHLANVGTHAYFEGGVKGVIVIHDFDDQWYAFERGCAFEPMSTCSLIWADSVELQLMCGNWVGGQFDPCCESRYTFAGFPLKGPARGRLAQYMVQRNANQVLVYN